MSQNENEYILHSPQIWELFVSQRLKKILMDFNRLGLYHTQNN